MIHNTYIIISDACLLKDDKELEPRMFPFSLPTAPELYQSLIHHYQLLHLTHISAPLVLGKMTTRPPMQRATKSRTYTLTDGTSNLNSRHTVYHFQYKRRRGSEGVNVRAANPSDEEEDAATMTLGEEYMAMA